MGSPIICATRSAGSRADLGDRGAALQLEAFLAFDGQRPVLYARGSSEESRIEKAQATGRSPTGVLSLPWTTAPSVLRHPED